MIHATLDVAGLIIPVLGSSQLMCFCLEKLSHILFLKFHPSSQGSTVVIFTGVIPHFFTRTERSCHLPGTSLFLLGCLCCFISPAVAQSPRGEVHVTYNFTCSDVISQFSVYVFNCMNE